MDANKNEARVGPAFTHHQLNTRNNLSQTDEVATVPLRCWIAVGTDLRLRPVSDHCCRAPWAHPARGRRSFEILKQFASPCRLCVLPIQD